MQIDREAIDKLLTLNDRQLQAVIRRLVSESGIDPAQFNIDVKSIAGIRSALTNADDEDLRRIAEQYEANKRRRG